MMVHLNLLQCKNVLDQAGFGNKSLVDEAFMNVRDRIRSDRQFLIPKKHEVSNHRSRVIIWDPSKLKEIPGHKDHGGLQLALNNNLDSFKSKLHHDIGKIERNQLKEKFLHSKGYTRFDFFTL